MWYQQSGFASVLRSAGDFIRGGLVSEWNSTYYHTPDILKQLFNGGSYRSMYRPELINFQPAAGRRIKESVFVEVRQ